MTRPLGSCLGLLLCLLLLLGAPLSAQDLDPRAYARVPVNATFLVSGFSLSHGGVVTDASLPLTDVGFGTVGFFRSLRVASPTSEAARLRQGAITFGVSLVVLGVAATVLSGAAHWFALRRLRRDEAPVLSRWPLSIVVALLLAVIGTVSLWSVFRR